MSKQLKYVIKMKKCINCKWHEIGFWYPECWANYKEYIKGGKLYQEFVGKLETDIEMNKNGDCQFYKEKRWWKKLCDNFKRSKQ
jgi:hypothetical protein